MDSQPTTALEDLEARVSMLERRLSDFLTRPEYERSLAKVEENLLQAALASCAPRPLLENLDDRIKFLAEAVTHLTSSLHQFQRKIQDSLHQIDLRLIQLDARMMTMEERLTKVESRLTAVETRLTAIETRLTVVESRLTKVESRLTAGENRLTTVESRLIAVEESVAGSRRRRRPKG